MDDFAFGWHGAFSCSGEPALSLDLIGKLSLCQDIFALHDAHPKRRRARPVAE
jgi:hypothetical protein